jgi:hypothetical protein
MRQNLRRQGRSGSRGKTAVTAALFALLLGAGACDSILEVANPDIVTPASLASEEGIKTLYAGAIGDLAFALSGAASGHGATPGLILMSGLMADEWDYSGTFPTRREADTRLALSSNGTMANIYSNMHRARAAAETAATAMEDLGVSDSRLGELRSLVGFNYTFFAETFCSGVPFSRATAEGELIFGDPITNAAMYQAAIQWFSSSAAAAGGSSDIARLAAVGQARAELGLGNAGAAAALVAGIPTDWVYNVEHSSNSRRQENGIYVLTAIRRQWSVAESKGVNGINFRSADDPRVPWALNEIPLGQDDRTTQYDQLKYIDSNAPVALASGIEARLIEAEAVITDPVALAGFHDALRATVGLPAVDLTGMTADELRAYHFRERAFWLYGTGHRQGDLRRLIRVYGQAADQTFPWGEYIKGGLYSTEVNFPVPDSEQNNPNFVGCIDRNP